MISILAIYNAFHAARPISQAGRGRVSEEHGCRLMCLEGQPFKIVGYLIVRGSGSCTRVTKRFTLI